MFKKFKGLFFNPKKEKVNKAEEMIQSYAMKTSFSHSMIQLYLKYIPQLKAVANGESVINSDEIKKGMYDFFKNYDNTDGFEFTAIPNIEGLSIEEHTEKIAATPLSVMSELETIPTPFNCENLNSKIEDLQDKTKLLNQRFAKQQIKGLTQRLENRKAYKENYKFFESFPNTTDAKIDALLQRYKLVIEKSDLFVPTFPKEAISIMKQYNKEVEKFTDETPVYYVIAEEKDFKKKYEKLAPNICQKKPKGL